MNNRETEKQTPETLAEESTGEGPVDSGSQLEVLAEVGGAQPTAAAEAAAASGEAQPTVVVAKTAGPAATGPAVEGQAVVEEKPEDVTSPAPEPTTMAELLASVPEATAEEAAVAAGERRERTAAELSEEGRRAARRGRPRLKLSELVVGTEMRGKVVGISEFGAFVDIGAVTDGLVHITELAQRRVRKVEDVLKQGDTVDVWVKEVDLENNRVGLSMRPRNLRPVESLAPGETLSGTVTSLTQYGAFVDVGAETEGLVHVSEMGNRRVAKPEDVVQVGDTVEVWVKEVDVAGRRIALSMRSRDLRALDTLQEGETFQGTVTRLVPFGAFVDIGAETEGLVHVSELADRRVARPEDVVKVGDTVTAWIKEVDVPTRRVSLSMRTRPSRPMASLEVGEVLTGTVASITKYGAFVNIGAETEGLVHVSAMGSGYVSDPAEFLEPGQEVEVRVQDVDLERGRISLSMVGLSSDVGGQLPAAEEPEVEPEPEEAEAEPEERQPTVVELALRKALGQLEDSPAEGEARQPKKPGRPAKKAAARMDDVYARMLQQYRSSKQQS